MSRAVRRLGFAGALVLLAGCEPHVVEAVEIPTMGESGTGGSSGSGTGGAGTGGVGGKACPDPERDRDDDKTPDCDDQCPDQPMKVEPGLCGCEVPDDDVCQSLLDVLVHRYAFEGSDTTTTVVDSKGGRDGVLRGDIFLDGSGAVTLGGGRRNEYVDLPNNLISVLDSVTLEAWVIWSGGAGWQRIFDFGDDGSGMEDSRNAGPTSTYLFLTTQLPQDALEGPIARVAYQRGEPIEAKTDATRAFAVGTETHVAVTYDSTSQALALYMDGELEDSRVFDAMSPVQIDLSAINDINCWLGRSLYIADATFGGRILEFRIYSEALSAAQVQTSYIAGDDPDFMP